MKKIYLLSAIFFSILTFSQSFHDTQGKLEISNSGQSVYTLPIAMPPSIQQVGPSINLIYSSGQMDGIAGQGWKISAISAISRISTRRDIDGYVDGVDFDANDMLALDGQRLILASGTYWVDGSTYQTEVLSNAKIELLGSGTSMYFIVTSPDGSRTWYGNYGGTNAIDSTAYYITRFEDKNGNFMTYHYSNLWGKSLCINEIKFSANTNGLLTPLNSIFFNYKLAKRVESGYIKGTKQEKVALLDNIEVKTNSLLFRKYQLTHLADAQLGYERVTQIQEFNGAMEPANPVKFEYNTTTTSSDNTEILTSYNNNIDFSDAELSGDFDGDGRLDFTTENKLYKGLFKGSSGQTPINFPTNLATGDKKYRFTATTLLDNKLNQFQSIVKVNPLSDGLRFDVYDFLSGMGVLRYSKTLNLGIPNLYGNYESSKTYEGDFNGDGISEVLIYSTSVQTIVAPDDPCHLIGTCGLIGIFPQIHILDLNPNSSVTSGSQGLANLGASSLLIGTTKNIVQDFNGDGKSDIIAINTNVGTSDYGKYIIYSFNQLTSSPWISYDILGSGLLDEFSDTKQMLFGDYNGDGRMDLMLPDTEGGSGSAHSLWHIYYSNPPINGGSFFVKETHTIVEYRPSSNGDYQTQTHVSNYYSLDTNGDGKSDLLRVWRRYYKPSLTINDHNTEWKATTFVNNIGNAAMGSTFTPDYVSPCYTVGSITECDHNSDSPDVPIPIVSNYRYAGLNNQLLMVRNHHNQVTYVNFPKDVSKDIRISKVLSSNGAIVDEIAYQSMEPTSNANMGSLSDFYSSSDSVNYPFVEVKRIPNNYLVSAIKNTVDGLVRFQQFRYHGLLIDMNGLGYIGFKKNARSNWHESSCTNYIWSVSENKVQWRGALERSYTQLVPCSQLFSFISSGNPSGIINSSINNFATSLTGSIFRLSLTSQIAKDFQTSVTNETNYQYESNYLYPLVVETKNYITNPSAPTGTSTITTLYETDNPSGSAANYFIGRPREISTTISAYSDTYSSTEKYTYLNNRISKTQKKGNTTANEYLVEEFEYNTYGNLIKKKLSTLGVIPVLQPRETTFTYDSTERFIKTSTDVDLLVTTSVAYDLRYGLVTESTNPYGFLTKTFFDNWGKPTKITDYLNKSINYYYLRSGNTFITSQIGADGGESKQFTDVLARIIKTGKKNVNGIWSYKNIEYDTSGRKYRESEPYEESSSNPTLWNSTLYDDYNRITSTTNSAGLITTLLYSDLTVSGTDGTRSTTSTKNANGHVISASDNGGIINYTYFANGNLKTSDFEGTILTMTYDEFGRKDSLSDPSAGPYSYKYNMFGELTRETTPKGYTDYYYDDFGKISWSRTQGLTPAEKTDIKSTYNYDITTKQVLSIVVENPNDGDSSYINIYDPTHRRLTKTTETNTFAEFVTSLEYDDFGRVSKETKTAKNLANSKSSTTKTRNYYENGFLRIIYDDATNEHLWAVESVNAKGQLTRGIYGNDITLTNTYDNFGFPINSNGAKLTETIVNNNGTLEIITSAEEVYTLQQEFITLRGNLKNRYNSLFGTTDNFQYDNFDRLIEWKPTPQTIHNNKFTGSVDAFTSEGGASVAAFINQLRVTATAAGSGAKKLIATNTLANTKFTIDAYINKSSMNKVRVVAIEENPTTGLTVETVLAEPNTGNYHTDYIISNNCNFYIRFDKSPTSTDVGTSKAFLIDNFIVVQTIIENQAYDNKGRIASNNLGTYNYTTSSKKYQNTSVELSVVGKGLYENRPTLNISYNAFKSPVKIQESANTILEFAYNTYQKRSTMFYGGNQTDRLLLKNRKHYSADGTMEIKHNIQTGDVEFITYIGGDAYSAPVISKGNGTTKEYLYLHRDYLGSIVAVSNQAGSIVEKRLFDAWGNITSIKDSAGNNLTSLTVIDRGYTGHEHLQQVGLIHMNGRLYDPVIHRFLQPDNYIVDPNNTQAYNRYGYVLNNPLKYSDVSGENPLLAIVLIGMAVSAATYTLTALLADVPFTTGGFLKASFIGAISATVTFGIGTYAQGITSFVERAVFQAFAHASFQAVMGVVQGGDFVQGLASGALSSIASSLYSGGTSFDVDGNPISSWKGLGGSFSGSGVGIISFGTVAGGFGSVLTGGNFWQGATTGLIVSGLNHYVHQQEIKNDIEKKYPRLYKVISKLKSFVEGNTTVLRVLSETSGYNPKQVLTLLSAKNLASMITVDPQGDWGHFDPENPSKISLKARLINGLEMVKLPVNLNLTSFFTAVTILHEFVHYGRYWNGLNTNMTINGVKGYEAGQIFETNAFGRIIGINGNEQIMNSNGWKF